MKKIALTSLLTVFAVSAASAATTPYVAAHVGYDTPGLINYENHEHMAEYFTSNNDFAYDLSIAGGVKHDLNQAFAVRGELEFDYMGGFVGHYKDGLDQADFRVHSYTALANAYLDIKTLTPLTPYVGAGLGYQWSHFAIPDQEALKPHGLAWQFGAGVSYALNSNLSLDLGYRYLASIDKENEEDVTSKWKIENHQFRLGAAYAF